MSRRTYALSTVLAFAGGLAAGHLSRPPAPPGPAPGPADAWAGPIRINVIDGTRVRGLELRPFRVVVGGEAHQVTPGGHRCGDRYQLIFPERRVEVFAEPAAAP